MDIKKVDEKPMVIHTKEKFKLHAKGTPKINSESLEMVTYDNMDLEDCILY